jgi:hypothetical protein
MSERLALCLRENVIIKDALKSKISVSWVLRRLPIIRQAGLHHR